MRKRFEVGSFALTAAMVLFSLSTSSVAAPQGASGDLRSVRSTPRLSDGTVNLGPGPGERGFWGTGGSFFGRGGRSHETNLLEEEIPLQPWARALWDQRRASNSADDPHAFCTPQSGPRAFTTVNGYELIQQPYLGRVIQIFGGGPHTWRVFYLDGRALPPDNDDRIPTFLGYNTARWEGDTLVIESTGYNERFWMHSSGIPHTNLLHLTERISRPSFEVLRYEVTIDDPGAYTEPWTGGFNIWWSYRNWDGTEGGEIHEYFCQDNERDSSHLVP